ncbi:cx9C motif-containing protein 4 isoform X2 [Lycorma delicatula]|uniref:cx9C motif-containing protein 4 isoform X2 n=1 Tax=Lycorma delicatula TaxID=130591 RepID=UPI003F519692
MKKDPCKRFACDIQKCLKENSFQEERCVKWIEYLRECCVKWKADSISCSGIDIYQVKE